MTQKPARYCAAWPRLSAMFGSLLLVLGSFHMRPAHAQFLGELNCGGWNFCPAGWAECNGQTLPIVGNDALFNLIGTTYGGDGQTTFALPNIQGRTLVHVGQGVGLTNRVIGETGGAESVALTTAHLPAHTHSVSVHTGSEKSATPTARIPAVTPPSAPAYSSATVDSSLHTAAVTAAGGSQAHNNLQPYLTMKCCIALQGIFPSP